MVNEKQAKRLERIRAERNARKISGGVRSDYGVPGMKWGEHKEQEAAQSAFSRGTAKASNLSKMSKEDRKKVLEEAPVGSKIEGIVVKNGPFKGKETTVEKVGGYSKVHGGRGAGSSYHEEFWTVGGEKYTGSVGKLIREASEGTSKYYELKK